MIYCSICTPPGLDAVWWSFIVDMQKTKVPDLPLWTVYHVLDYHVFILCFFVTHMSLTHMRLLLTFTVSHVCSTHLLGLNGVSQNVTFKRLPNGSVTQHDFMDSKESLKYCMMLILPSFLRISRHFHTFNYCHKYFYYEVMLEQKSSWSYVFQVVGSLPQNFCICHVQSVIWILCARDVAQTAHTLFVVVLTQQHKFESGLCHFMISSKVSSHLYAKSPKGRKILKKTCTWHHVHIGQGQYRSRYIGQDGGKENFKSGMNTLLTVLSDFGK